MALKDKKLGFAIKQARLENKWTYEELSERSGVSSSYIKEIENHGSIPSLAKFGALIRALSISADPFIYPISHTDSLDYKKLDLNLRQCTDSEITVILALVEAYLRTSRNPIDKNTK